MYNGTNFEMLKTVGIIIIGNEILNGEVSDLNASFLCKRFHKLGIEVGKVSFLPDKIEVISEEIIKFTELFDYVITTGGVGPTHDDVTYESIGAAFGEDLLINDTLKTFFGSYLAQGDQSSLKLVTIPKCSEVILAHLEEPLPIEGTSYFPIVKTYNVYSFPGIPLYVQRVFSALENIYFKNNSLTYFSRVIHLNVDEVYFVAILNEIVSQFEDSVTFGSYPRTHEACEYEAKITIESTSFSKCLAAEKALLSKIPPNWVLFLKPRLPDFHFINELSQCNCKLAKALVKSSKIIEEAFSKFSISDTFISFNGGKDCTVLFNLVYCFALKKNLHKNLKLVYFKEADSFPEVDSFIEEVKNSYEVDLVILPTPMKSSLRTYLKKESNIKACFIGLREIDPKTKSLNYFQETDADWPKLLRILPILHWSYTDIWNFIRCFNVPYCCLYNQGYTSLGSKSNTTMNPLLKFQRTDGSVYYKPAFLLAEEHAERAGRTLSSDIINSESKY